MCVQPGLDFGPQVGKQNGRSLVGSQSGSPEYSAKVVQKAVEDLDTIEVIGTISRYFFEFESFGFEPLQNGFVANQDVTNPIYRYDRSTQEQSVGQRRAGRGQKRAMRGLLTDDVKKIDGCRSQDF